MIKSDDGHEAPHSQLILLPTEVKVSVMTDKNIAYKYLSDQIACDSFIEGNIGLPAQTKIDFITMTHMNIFIIITQEYLLKRYRYHLNHLMKLPFLMGHVSKYSMFTVLSMQLGMICFCANVDIKFPG